MMIRLDSLNEEKGCVVLWCVCLVMWFGLVSTLFHFTTLLLTIAFSMFPTSTLPSLIAPSSFSYLFSFTFSFFFHFHFSSPFFLNHPSLLSLLSSSKYDLPERFKISNFGNLEFYSHVMNTPG